MAEHTHGPWITSANYVYAPGPNGANICVVSEPRATTTVQYTELEFGSPDSREAYANARLIASAPDLLEAAQLQESAEDAHANCQQCEGQGVPECCEKCFPLFDNARIKRRLAIAKATGPTL